MTYNRMQSLTWSAQTCQLSQLRHVLEFLFPCCPESVVSWQGSHGRWVLLRAMAAYASNIAYTASAYVRRCLMTACAVGGTSKVVDEVRQMDVQVHQLIRLRVVNCDRISTAWAMILKLFGNGE